MRYMIDSNIILDVLLEREPFYSSSRRVLDLCEDRRIMGFISASTATDIFYLIRKALGSIDAAYNSLGSILRIVSVLTVTNDDVSIAFEKRAKDFEDCLLATCAISNHCDGIVTRNSRDFIGFDIDILSPEDVA
ncbi:MAG: PIN domain-containing protein [Spirochaetales bacterium]|nr:PIN domain-containing protein [Spirochaetales bacterium]